MFDCEVVTKNYNRSKPYINDHNFLHEIAAQELIDATEGLTIVPKNILVLGHFPLLQALSQRFPNAHIENVEAFTTDPLKQKYDVILSVGHLQWVNAPLEYIINLKNNLNTEGCFGCVLPGEDTFANLRKAFIHADMDVLGGANMRVNPTISASDSLQLLQAAKFKDPLVHVSGVELKHTSVYDLVLDIRNMGGSVALKDRRREFTPKKVFDAADIYLKGNKDHFYTLVDLIVMVGHN